MTTERPAVGLQIAVDCADPHLLARFWADALGYELEDHHDIVVGALGAGFATDADTIEIDGRKAWAGAAACRDPQGERPRLLFQQVPEPKAVKNRVHLDLHVPRDQLGELTGRVLAHGATKLWDGELGGQRWVTYADPEGNEFCLATV